MSSALNKNKESSFSYLQDVPQINNIKSQKPKEFVQAAASLYFT